MSKVNLSPCCFLDRDGCVNIAEKGKYVNDHSQFELLPDVGRAVYLLNELGFKVIVVTNQAGIGKGYFNEQDLLKIHNKMRKQVGWYSGKITDVFHCPHSVGCGNHLYDFECNCRKPKPGLIREAARRHDIDVSKSYMIGDSITDIEAGKAAGCKKNILVLTGFGKESYEEYKNRVIENPNYSIIVCDDLLDAAHWIQEDLKNE